MNRRSKLALTAAGIFTCAGLGSYLAVPRAAKWYIEKEYPGVTVQEVKVRPAGAYLSLMVDRPGLRATLPDVFVSRHKRVVVTGGRVELEIGDSEAASGQAKGYQLTAHGLNVTVKRKGWEGRLEGAALLEDGTITVVQGSVTGPEASGFVTGIRKSPDGAVTVAHAEVTLTRKLPIKQPFTLEGITLPADHTRAVIQTALVDGQRADGITVERVGEVIVAQAASVTVQHEWANPVPVIFKLVSLTVADGAVTAEIGGARISWFRDSKTIDGVGSCEAWVAAFPQGLREPLEGLTFTGKVDFRVSYGDKPGLTLNGSCRAKCDAARLKDLHKPFHYKVYSAKNDLVDRISGPGSKDWTPLGILNPTLPTAAITMEDPGFLHHRGFDVSAYRNSLIYNLKLRRFNRGGSTITMQLAKNLWLRRDKTFGRKAQEFFLAQALESCFTKDEILELYLNVVEFGPDLYGIGPAAERYFKVSAGSLSPVQAFWLASILPRPRSAVTPSEATLERIHKLMTRFANDGRIPESYLEEPASPPDDSEWGQ